MSARSIEFIIPGIPDVLQLDTSAFLADGGGFVTDGPELTYDLDFYVNFFAGLDVDLFGFDVISPSIGTNGERVIEILSFDSDTSPTLSATFPFGISGDLTWPNLEVTNEPGTYSGFGESNNFLDINLDADDLLADLFLAGASPLSFGGELSFPGQTAGFSVDLLDADLMAGAKFEQAFDMEVGDLSATLTFEDGTTQAFTFGERLVLDNASTMDVDGDGDIEFDFELDIQNTQVTNDTDLQFNVGWGVSALQGSANLDTTLGSTSASIGPVASAGQAEIPVASLNVYEDTFVLDFDAQDYLLVA